MMQHSLRQRFRGALLGAALGESLGLSCGEGFASPACKVWRSMQQQEGQPESLLIAPLSQFCWSKAAVAQSQFFASGLFRQEETLPLSAIDRLELAGVAIATLPIALFYHEDWYQLQQALEQVASAWRISLPITPILTVAYTVSLALRERLHLETLIPRLITDLELHDRDPQLMQQLNQVQGWVQQRAGIALPRSLMQEIRLGSSDASAVTIALYGFLSTPADFQLSLLRTAQMLRQPQIACAIVGALSGAYNGLAAIPLHWRRAFNATMARFAILAPLVSEAELLQQSDRLWASWSGADNPEEWLQQCLPPTIASPHLIRPR